jgi:predicted SAM-dependent methyltransferase
VNPRLRATVRAVVMAANKPVATARCRRALDRAPRPFRLEIGGLHKRAGWVITNVNAITPHYLDATKPWPIEDAALSRVYADNMIEHVPLEAGRAMFAEAYRCLQPGGVIRLVTPDLRKHVDLYLAGAPSVRSEVGDSYRAWGLTVEHPVDLLRIPIGSFGHHVGYLYDFDTLKAELEAAGFNEVVECPINDSAHDDLKSMDQRTGESAAQMAVEATR